MKEEENENVSTLLYSPGEKGNTVIVITPHVRDEEATKKRK